MTITSGNDLYLNAVTDINITSGTSSDILLNSLRNVEIMATGDVNISNTVKVVIDDADLRIQQTNYTQPMTSNIQLGYTNTKTATTNPMSNTLAERMNFSIPSKGVWLIIGQLYWETNASNTVEVKEAVISTVSGALGSSPAAYGLVYYDQINDSAGAAEKRQHLNINGVYTATAATTLYCNARSQVSSGTNTIFNISASWTRIG
jgi:hypothetical protein